MSESRLAWAVSFALAATPAAAQEPVLGRTNEEGVFALSSG